MNRNISFLDKLILLHSGFGMLAGWALVNMGTLFSLLFVPLARRDPSFVFGYAFLLMPLAGVVLLVIHYRRNGASLALLLHGTLTKGIITRAVKTGATVRYKYETYPMVAYTATFKDSNGRDHTLNVTTYQSIYEDAEKGVWIIYDTTNLENATLYDSIGNAPSILDNGQFASLPFATLRVLILPIIFVVLFGRLVLRIILGLLGLSFLM